MEIETPHWLESLEFDRLGRARFVLDFDEDEPQKSIDRMCEEIAEEYLARQKARHRAMERATEQARLSSKASTVRAETPLALKWLKPVCYNAILACLHWDVFDCLEARIKRCGRLKRGRTTERSLFMTGLVAIFAHLPAAKRKRRTPASRKVRDKHQRNTFSDEKGRARIAEDMWWAFRHYVEPGELNAFTRKHRCSLNALATSGNCILPALADHVARRRVMWMLGGVDIEEFGGRYPAHIDELANAYEQEISDRMGAAQQARR